MTGFTDDVRSEIVARAQGRCEARCSAVCRGQGVEAHHRLLRSHNDHRTVNGLLVCLLCHELLHRVGEPAYAAGLLVHAWDDPASVPVSPGLFGSWVTP